MKSTDRDAVVDEERKRPRFLVQAALDCVRQKRKELELEGSCGPRKVRQRLKMAPLAVEKSETEIDDSVLRHRPPESAMAKNPSAGGRIR